MTPAQYFQPLLGQSLLYPGQSESLRGQCVQSVMLWLRDTGTNPPIYRSAFMYYTNGIPGYTKIPVGSPIHDGDVVVYGSAFPITKGNGHIDVATGDGTPKDYWAYDSNWKPLVLTKTHHNGSDNQYIMGYLRKNIGDNMPSVVDRDMAGRLLAAYFTPSQIQEQGGEKFIQSWTGTESNNMIRALDESPQYRNKRLDAEQSLVDLKAAQDKIKQLESSGGVAYREAGSLDGKTYYSKI